MKWKSVVCEMKGLNIYYFVYLRNTIDNLVHWAIDHLPHLRPFTFCRSSNSIPSVHSTLGPMQQTQWLSSKGNSCHQMTLKQQKVLLEILFFLALVYLYKTLKPPCSKVNNKATMMYFIGSFEYRVTFLVKIRRFNGHRKWTFCILGQWFLGKFSGRSSL